MTAAKRFKIRPGPRAASENAAGRERSPPETVHANTVLQHRQHTLGEDPILYHETYHAAAKRVVAGSAFAGTTKGSWSMLRRMPESTRRSEGFVRLLFPLVYAKRGVRPSY